MKDGRSGIGRIVLGVLLMGIPLTAMASEKTDTTLINRIFRYQQRWDIGRNDSLNDRVYTKFRFDVERRNPTLWVIPTTYVFARGERKYLSESYSHLRFSRAHEYDVVSNLRAGTIRRNRTAMPPLLDFVTPHIYDIDLYNGHILSPFHRVNRRFYHYSIRQQTDSTTRLEFRPKFYNTQLTNGYAIIETATGRVKKTLLNGEFDMITFRSEIIQEDDPRRPMIPKKTSTAAIFRFMGNRISTVFDGIYGCQTPLPDNLDSVPSRVLMDSLRPIPLTEADREIYEAYDQKHRPDTTSRPEPPETSNQRLGRFLWDMGDNLVTPIAAESKTAYFRLSPIINPLYLSYSHHRGLRYKMRLHSGFSFNAHRYLNFNPTFGYNFKIRKFYFTAPLRMTYNPKRNGYAEIVYGNGNRISNSSVMDVIKEANHDTLNLDETDMDMFDDDHLLMRNNIMVFPWLDVESGFILHRRRAVNRELMRQYSMPDEYRSFAPMLGLKFSPWLDNGPTLAVDWERAFKGINGSNLDYERWELDAQWKHRIPGLRVLNMRAGSGFYSRKKQNYFVDFANFHDENLPEGWDDDWSGDFQLLRSHVYNESNYYVRGNLSYESPMLFATWLPYVGKYIEKERFYVSAVSLAHTRLYYELGYGFTNRYISVGLFASFLGKDFQRAGVQFDFELFKRW